MVEGDRILQQQKPIKPFEFLPQDENGKYIQKPFYFVDKEIDTPDRFAILRTTENGKYVRGGSLYFKLDDVEIYTDIDSVIFVDIPNKIMRVQNAKKVEETLALDKPEERQYILLIKCYESGNEYYQWESMIGRLETYNFIVDNIESMGIVPNESIVLTENVAVKDALTIEEFIKYLQNSKLVDDDGFDIDQYIY